MGWINGSLLFCLLDRDTSALAHLGDEGAYYFSTHRFGVSVPASYRRLRRNLYTLGDSSLRIAQHIGKCVAEILTELHEGWFRHQFVSFFFLFCAATHWRKCFWIAPALISRALHISWQRHGSKINSIFNRVRPAISICDTNGDYLSRLRLLAKTI